MLNVLFDSILINKSFEFSIIYVLGFGFAWALRDWDSKHIVSTGYLPHNQYKFDNQTRREYNFKRKIIP